ncbi:MAG TPA: hypothetical protein ENG12_04770 [Candidatus Altiarchaeales archaeon]|nr:hypothetical protein [Candidatus Altiarchaeales archaeon]
MDSKKSKILTILSLVLVLTVGLFFATVSGEVIIGSPCDTLWDDGIFEDNFTDGSFDSIWIISQSGGASVSEVDGRLLYNVPSGNYGVVNGIATICCPISGDFDVQVDFSLQNFPEFDVEPPEGLQCGARWHGIFILTKDGRHVGHISRFRNSDPENPVAHNAYAATLTRHEYPEGYTFVATTDISGKLRVKRTDDLLELSYWRGDDWVILLSGSTLTDDVYISLVSGYEGVRACGPPPSGHSAIFDNFTLRLPDTDGDALLDVWETRGFDYDLDGVIDLDLPSMGANWQHKDIFIEVDYMEHNRPINSSIDNVTKAFANAPVDNPDGTQGITLHVFIDEEVPYQYETNIWDGFDAIKRNHFGSPKERGSDNWPAIRGAKWFTFRYCLFINKQRGTNSSGIAEISGNDFIVSLGAWPSWVWGRIGGRQDAQAGTFMHELGHTLGLRHGGCDDINYKPNYLSVMSYSRQFSRWIHDRPLDYSRKELPPLDEDHLNESAGIGAGAEDWTVYFVDTNGDGINDHYRVVRGNEPIDWNNNGSIDTDDVSAEINSIDRNHNHRYDIPREGDGRRQRLRGYDDWANLVYNFRMTPSFAPGVHLNVAEPDLSWEEVIWFREAPRVSIITDKLRYSPGDIMTIILNITNPTGDSIFQWYWGVPQYRIWLPVTTSSYIPAGYNDTVVLNFTIPDWGSRPFGNVFYVQLLDATGEVLDADAACWAYSPSGEAMPEEKVDIAKEIKKTIEMIE